jgi:hypothetical protein
MALSSDDARIAGRASRDLINQAKTDEDRKIAASIAQRALGRDGTVVPAAVALGVYAGLSGKERSSAAWFDYSEKLSRRDIPTQFYFIEKSVAAGNVGEALRHYDMALRVSPEKSALVLYPILRAAAANLDVRQALAGTLASRPVWADGFLYEFAVKGPDYVAAAQLFNDLRRLKVAIRPDIDATLLNNLIAQGDVSTAWKYYAANHPGAGASTIRNTNFNIALATNSPFDWQLSSADGVAANFDRDDRGGVLDYRLSPTVGGVVAHQIIFVPAGKYRLESVMSSSSQTVGSGASWQLACSNGTPIGVMEIGGPMESGRRFAADVTVPANCTYQSLSLVVRSSDDVQGARGRVDFVSLLKRD